MTLSALMCVRNEEDVLEKAIELIHPYVDEIIVVDMQSSDKTPEIAKKFSKVKYFEYPYIEPIDMGKARTFSLGQATGDWFLQIDADEYYPPEPMEKIKAFIENPGEAISLRIAYKNLAWKVGYCQADFGHYPDRLYKREVVQGWEGVLPLDMTVVKPDFRSVAHKSKGMQGVLEYDNDQDLSFESQANPSKNPKQPVRKDIFFYHLARCRGHWFEYNKKVNYEKQCGATQEQAENNARHNQWVSGLYPMEETTVPDYVPTKIIPNPKVSIVIPLYNKAPYIQEAIDSCLNQSVKPYEIIVIDDGSTDNPQIQGATVYKQTNQGVATARNNGLDKTTGDYFILLDADDKLHPDFIKRCLEEIGDNQIVYTDFQGMGEWEGRVHHALEPEYMRTGQVVPSTMALCDRRVLDPYGNFKSIKTFEDAEFWLNCYYERKMKFKHIPEVLCYYRRTQGTRIDYLNQTADERYAVLNNLYAKHNVHYA